MRRSALASFATVRARSPSVSSVAAMARPRRSAAARKRFSLTAKGKVRGNVGYKQHGMRKRPQKMIRSARGTMILSDADAKIIKKFLPYG